MANIRKSFNFRTGLQVDNDNFVVNANGLVGIGTSIPQGYLLNVHGDTRVTGLVTTGELYAGIGTVGVLSATSADVSGILTVGQFKVGSSEIVDNLIGYARTTFITDNAGVGFHTTSKLGINTTTSPGVSDSNFNVYGDVSIKDNLTVTEGDLILTSGDINASSGIITASSFDGNLNATDLTSGTVNNSRLPATISVTNVNAAFTGNLTGTATTASSLTGSPSITVTDISASDISASNVSSGVITATTELNVGSDGTALTALSTGRLGIGTALPTSEIQVRKASGSLVEVVSDSGEARISIGNSVGVGNSSALLRFGNSSNDFDIINYDIGDIRNILGSSTNPSTGSFKWIDGDVNAERMTLTYDGNLGINETSPSQKLHVGGGATVDGAAYIQNDLTVGGIIYGDIDYPPVINSVNLNTISGVTTLSSLEVTQTVNFDTASTVSLGNTVAIGTDITSASYALRVDNGLTADAINSDDTIDATGTITGNIVRASAGFLSNISGSPIQIDYQSGPDRIVFTVNGIGSTSLLLS